MEEKDNFFIEEVAKINQTIDFNLSVVKLILGKNDLNMSFKSKEKIVQFYNQQETASDKNVFLLSLESLIESSARRCKNNTIEAEDLVLGQTVYSDYLPIPAGLKLEDLERKYILQTLYFVQQNRTKAADILGISIRTLRNKINQYRMEGYL